ATHPIIQRLTPTVRRHHLDPQCFRDLIEANRRDQVQQRYATFDVLLGYSPLPANPVGRLVLGVFDVRDPVARTLSDDVCSALQVIEHLQDLGADVAVGRFYMPPAAPAACGCSEDDLPPATADLAVRRLVSLECGRARRLLDS